MKNMQQKLRFVYVTFSILICSTQKQQQQIIFFFFFLYNNKTATAAILFIDNASGSQKLV